MDLVLGTLVYPHQMIWDLQVGSSGVTTQYFPCHVAQLLPVFTMLTTNHIVPEDSLGL